MKVVFDSFDGSSNIPARDYVRKKKMVKYFSRLSAAAMVSFGKLANGITLTPDMPIYYATGPLTHGETSYFHEMCDIFLSSSEPFSNKIFIERALPKMSPLHEFGALYNMPVCFISIEYGLVGDNASLCCGAAALLEQAKHSVYRGNIILGAGKLYPDGRIESAFAALTKAELNSIPQFSWDEDAIELFRVLEKEKAL